MLHRIVRSVTSVLLLFLLHGLPLHADDLQRPLVVASIRPLYLILLALTDQHDVEVRQLLDAAVSAHDFVLRPSQLRSLRDARQIFWIGPALEHPLAELLPRLSGPSRDSALLGMLDLRPRPDGAVDPHVWLDPRLALQLAMAMDRILVERALLPSDPQRIDRFAASMRETEGRMIRELAGVQQQPFAVMHDGYAYFVERFGPRTPVALALDAEQQVGARTLARMRSQIRDQGARCLLSERSGGNRALAMAIARGAAIPVIELDSLAADAPADSAAFADFLVATARRVAACLREVPSPDPDGGVTGDD